MAENYLSATEIAKLFSVSRSRAYEIIAALPHVKAGRTVRVPESAFKRWLEDNTVRPLPVAGPPRRFSTRPRGAKPVSAPAISGDGSTIRRMAPRT